MSQFLYHHLKIFVLGFFALIFFQSCYLISNAQCEALIGGDVSAEFKKSSSYKSQAGRCFSSSVIVEWEPRVPVVFFQGRENVVCRKGLPRRYIPPWDIRFIQRGRTEQAGSNIRDAEEENNDAILTSVGNYWFKATPLIDNKSNHYLIITDINLRVTLNDRGQTQSTEVSFSDGYCDTTPLYIFDNSGLASGDPASSNNISNPNAVHGSFTHFSDINKSFVMGNLVFYAGGLPEPSSNTEGNDRQFGDLKIPRYTVYWQMLGTFYRLENNNQGEYVANFQKRGSFTTQPSSF